MSQAGVRLNMRSGAGTLVGGCVVIADSLLPAHVPQDIPGLIKLKHRDAGFIATLDELFARSLCNQETNRVIT